MDFLRVVLSYSRSNIKGTELDQNQEAQNFDRNALIFGCFVVQS